MKEINHSLSGLLEFNDDEKTKNIFCFFSEHLEEANERLLCRLCGKIKMLANRPKKTKTERRHLWFIPNVAPFFYLFTEKKKTTTNWTYLLLRDDITVIDWHLQWQIRHFNTHTHKGNTSEDISLFLEFSIQCLDDTQRKKKQNINIINDKFI